MSRMRPTDTIWDVVARWSEEYLPATQPGSAADEDYRLSPEWDTFTAAWDAWLGAVDHLEALGDLMNKAGVVHTFAPWSLLRIAIENAALSVWLLQPDSATERLSRRLRLAWGDWGDAVELERRLAREQEESSATAYRERVKTLAQELQLDVSVVCGRWSWAVVVRDAASLGQIATPTSAEFSWRVCSGFAHAREWPRMLMLNVATSDPDADGRVAVDLSTDRERLFNVLFVAFDLASEARRQIERRRLTWRESRSR